MRPTLLGLALIASTTVFEPSLAAAWHAGDVVIDGYRLPRDHRFESQDEKGGKRYAVDINDVPRLIRQGKPVFDKTGDAWVSRPNGTINQKYVAAGASRDKDKDKDKWQRVHGQVQSVEGSTLRLRADDGRVLNVDMSKVSPEIRRALTQNERVTVIGFGDNGKNRFRAEYIQQDSSGGASSASTRPARSGSQGIRGHVAAIGGTTMDMRTDDGRTLVVNLDQIPADLVKSLNPGDPVTVTGTLDGRNLTAKSLTKSASR
jgi:hypothetical protein